MTLGSIISPTQMSTAEGRSIAIPTHALVVGGRGDEVNTERRSSDESAYLKARIVISHIKPRHLTRRGHRRDETLGGVALRVDKGGHVDHTPDRAH